MRQTIITLTATLAVASCMGGGAYAKPTEETHGGELEDALSDSKACWVSNWGDTTAVYWSKGLDQKQVVEVGDFDTVGDALSTIMEQCY